MQKNPGQQGPLGEESPQSPQNIPGRPQREKKSISTKQESWCAACTDWKTKWEAFIELITQQQHSSSNHTPLGNPECKNKLFSYPTKDKKPLNLAYWGTIPVGQGIYFRYYYACLSKWEKYLSGLGEERCRDQPLMLLPVDNQSTQSSPHLQGTSGTSQPG